MDGHMDYEESFGLIAEEEDVEDLTRKLMRNRIGIIFMASVSPGQLADFEGKNLGKLPGHR